ncbi:MAG TPA: potassium transporter TrkG [Tepidisphaeraceae bacterium]|nr:potassium transporter TrkG [Tepidisphaeraceae bacterium]
MIVGGYFLLRSPAANVAGNEMTADRALFSAVNAATLTGFQSSVALDQYQPLAVATMLGLMFGGILFTFVIGSLAVRKIARLPWSPGQIVRASIFYTSAACAVGTVLLLPGRSLPDAIFLAVSSFGNCGLFTGQLPGVHGWQTQFVILPLAVAGGLGLPILMEFTAMLTRRGGRLTRQAGTVLTWYAGVYLVVLILVFVFRAGSLDENFASTFSTCSALSANARTLGLPLAAIGDLARSVQWILIFAMAIGGAPASTSGGIKVTCVAELVRGIRQSLRGEVPDRAAAIAAVWFGIYALVVGAALLILLNISPDVPADRLLFHVVSAASNVGLSFDTISAVGNGLYILTSLMFFGRVAAWLIVWWQADTADGPQVAVA